MAYIGNIPADKYTSFAKQDFTVTATTSYTLDHSVSNENEIALFINFVRQEPTTAYTASGTSLTLTEATSVGDDMYCVFIGKAVQTVTPADGTVTSSMLASGNLTIPNGNLLFDTASKGIYLGVTSATASNLLDDYEEGTFTPEFADASTGGNTGTGTFFGAYTKIGNLVYVQIRLFNIDTTGMTSGNSIHIRNLPFTSESSGNGIGTVLTDRVSFSGYLTTNMPTSGTYTFLTNTREGTTDTNLTVSAIIISGGSDININMTYRAV